MSAIVESDTSSRITDGQNGDIEQSLSRNDISLDSKNSSDDIEIGQDDNEKSEPGTPKPHPMAFTIDFGQGKQFDKERLEKLAKQSQARHQRVQSMSASLTRPSPVAQKPPMSAKLPRKAQGYNSEGYFSSDQEDSILSGSVKLRQSPLAQNAEKNITSPTITRHLRSPDFTPVKKISKSPIVDSIMSRSDILPSRQSLNLPLKQTNSSYMRDIHRTPSYGNLSATYQPRHTMADIIDQSPEGIMLTDISSPELDILTPDNGLSTPEHKSPSYRKSRRTSSETPDLLKRCPPHEESLYIDDDDLERQSNNSSTGTYTIEGDNYTEEQKARMSIDRTFGNQLLNKPMNLSLKKNIERDPELIFDYPNNAKVITKEPRRDIDLRSTNQCNTLELPSKVSKDKNVLEISCCYESPTENDLAVQTSKQIKSTRSYLEKIKNRVKTITEKTFSKSPPKHLDDADLGNFTSVTTSGVLSTKNPPKHEVFTRLRRCSLTKSEIDQTDYIHRLSREASVPVSLPSNKPVLSEPQFESTALRNAHAKALRDDSGVSSDITPEAVVGKLSYLSLNRCKGDKTWIQEWADSVKKYNSNTLAVKDDGKTTFVLTDKERSPLSPKHLTQTKCKFFFKDILLA